MARPLRVEFADGLYHVTSRGERCENQQILIMQYFYIFQMVAQRVNQRFRQQHQTVFKTFAIANQDFLAGKINVFNTQAQALHDSHAGAIKQIGD